MTEITVDVGSLYGDVHEQLAEELGDQYTERLRAQTEDFIHEFNQQVERQMEQ